MMRKISLCLGAASMLALCCAAPAQAQQTATVSAGVTTDDAADSDIVVVTARRLQERLQDVPVSVTAVSDETLQSLQAKNIGDLQSLSPNLNIAQGRGSNSSANVFIRGIGQPDALATFDPAVGVYVDDVFLSRIRGALVDVYDVDRVEVLRGPQGTLFGKNTEAGAIRLITKQPLLNGYAVDARFGFGSFDQREASVNLRGALIEDKLGAKLAFRYSGNDGYIFDPLAQEERNGSDNFNGRFSLLGKWTNAITSRLDLDVENETADLQLGRRVNGAFRTGLGPAGFPVINPIPGFGTPATGEYNFQTSASPGLPNSISLLHWGASLNNSWEINPALTLKGIVSYRELTYGDNIDIDATPFQLGDVFVGVDQSQLSAEIQAQYTTKRIKGVFGLYYLNELIRSDQVSLNNDAFLFFGLPTPFRVFIDDRQELDSFAAFFQSDVQLIQNLSLTLGLRATYEEKDYAVLSRRTVTAAGVGVFGGRGSANFFDLAPRVGLNYKVTPDILAYVSYAQGFKSGGFNGRASSALQLEPYAEENVGNVEGGLKTSWFKNRITLNVDGFYNNYKDFQASVPGLAEDGRTPVNTVFNAGRLTQYGFEVEGGWKITQDLVFTGNVGFLDSGYSEFFGQRFVNGQLVQVDLSNRRPAFAPRWNARAQGAYTWPTPEKLGEFTTTVAGSYRGDTGLTIESDQAPLLFQPNYWLLDAFMNWTAPNEKFSINGGVRNITDEVYAVDGQNFTTIGGIQTLYYAPPRNWSVSVNMKF